MAKRKRQQDGAGKPRAPAPTGAAPIDDRDREAPAPVDDEDAEAAGDETGEIEAAPGSEAELEQLADGGEPEGDVAPVDVEGESETGHADSTQALSLRDPYAAYVREVQRYPLLSGDEERELTVKYGQTGDPEIARRLVTANLRLVIKLAYEYRRAYKNVMDLIQEGNIGLMQAVKRFDPYRGVKLSSYSAWWIRAYMLRFILNNWRLVKLGTTQAQRKLFFNLNKQKAKLAAMGIEPTPDAIAGRLGVKPAEVQEMDRRLGASESSLDAPIAGTDEGRQVPRIETMASEDAGTDEAVAQQELSALLNEALKSFRDTLDGKDLIIFDKRIVTDEPLTLQRLGEEFGVSRERVRQLEARVVSRLRDYLKSELGEGVELGV